MRKLKNSVPCKTCGELFVPGGAHMRHEKACDPSKKRRRRSRYRDVFFATYGPGPYDCYFECGELLEFDYVIVHHIDEDHSNDSPENLAPAHRVCHNRHHFNELWKSDKEKILKGRAGLQRKPFTEETKARMSKNAKERGMRPTSEAIEKARQVNTGSKRTDDVRQKMSTYAKNRTPEHQAKLNEAQRNRVVTEETRRRMSESAKARTDRKKSLGGDAK